MADADFDEFGGYESHAANRHAGPARGVRAQRWINGAGALTSVALIAGLGLWGYGLAVRDVRGVPVIRALEGPARVAPDNPGGELASYQGMAVNEIAADGTAGDPADRLTLAPAAEGLAPEDRPMGALAAPSDGALPEPPAPAAAPVTPASAPALRAGAPARPDEPLPDGAADSRIDGGALAPGETAAALSPAPAGAISPAIAGVSQSLRPQGRPAAGGGGDATGYDAIAEAAALAVAEAMAPGAGATAVDVAPETLGEGTRLVQIGAYPDAAQARLEWDKAAARFGALMDGKRRVIEAAEAGGGAFYRLRVEGFSDIEDARRFCEVLKAEGAECVPTAVR